MHAELPSPKHTRAPSLHLDSAALPRHTQDHPRDLPNTSTSFPPRPLILPSPPSAAWPSPPEAVPAAATSASAAPPRCSWRPAPPRRSRGHLLGQRPVQTKGGGVGAGGGSSLDLQLVRAPGGKTQTVEFCPDNRDPICVGSRQRGCRWHGRRAWGGVWCGQRDLFCRRPMQVGGCAQCTMMSCCACCACWACDQQRTLMPCARCSYSNSSSCQKQKLSVSTTSRYCAVSSGRVKSQKWMAAKSVGQMSWARCFMVYSTDSFAKKLFCRRLGAARSLAASAADMFIGEVAHEMVGCINCSCPVVFYMGAYCP